MRSPDVITDLGTLRPAVVDDELEEQATHPLGELEAERREIILKLRADAKDLGEATDWPRQTLLDRIGCPVKTDDDLEGLPLDRLENCQIFLGLLLESARLVSTRSNCRAVTMACAQLVVQTRRDAKGLAQLFQQGEPSPWEYLELGEIAQAARAVRVNADTLQPGDDDKRGPFADATRVHISTPRLDAYALGEREVLGEPVFQAITTHIDDCSACGDAASYRREKLGL